MALRSELMASGENASLARKLGLDPFTTFAAAGSGQSSATVLTANCFNVSSGSGGVALKSSEDMAYGVNNSGGSITLYPPIGSGANFNGGTANAGITVPNGKSVFVYPAGTTLMANISA